MIKLFRKIIIFKFKLLTATYLKIKKIKVVAITGSVGKTTTKNFIGQLLEDSETYVPKENLNTEIGLPLVIFKLDLPENTYSVIAWSKILILMFFRLFRKAGYKRIVLEMGADKPGDIAFLTSFARPDISVITAVSAAHLVNFHSLEKVAAEKSKIIEPLKESSIAVLNYDDEAIRKMSDKTRGKIFWIGSKAEADLSYDKLIFTPEGLHFEIRYQNKKFKVQTRLIAPQFMTCILAATGVCLRLGVEIDRIIERIKELEPQKGRMSVLSGVEDTILIDDSYNSNPTSALAALEVLAKYNGRKIAVLGRMNELGEYEKEAHQIVAKASARSADILYLVGEGVSKYMAEVAKTENKAIEVEVFASPYKVGERLRKTLKKQDVVLFKGSQNGVFLEEAIKYVLKNREDAGLLVRQSNFWLRKKEQEFKVRRK